MSELRSLIRQILAEEIAALRSESPGGPQVERVRAGSAAELTEFALSVLAHIEDLVGRGEITSAGPPSLNGDYAAA